MSTGSSLALGAEIVARHRRSYVRGDVVYDPLHYLSLLERKPGALDQAAPLRGWKLDPAFDTLRRLLEARFGPRGKREYIQVLRLLEDFPERQVTAAVQDAVTFRAPDGQARSCSSPASFSVAVPSAMSSVGFAAASSSSAASIGITAPRIAGVSAGPGSSSSNSSPCLPMSPSQIHAGGRW